MSSPESGAVVIEQKISYGIGGAGNIRRPSDVIYPPRTNADGTRRLSGWSSVTASPGTSPEGRRASFMKLFRKSSGSDAGEGPSSATDKIGEEVRNGLKFKDVNLSGKTDAE